MQSLPRIINGYGFYRRVIWELNKQRVPFLVGGAQMLERCSGITRELKDLDIYICRRDLQPALEVLSTAGYRTEICFSHWLAKACEGPLFVDLIFSSGNGICEVNGRWFEHAIDGEVFGMPIRFCPPEEMIWSKAFVMERERYDGADIAHLFLCCGRLLDWRRLLQRFEPHWRVLLSYLILFGFIYPTERSLVPEWIMRELLNRVQNEMGGRAEEDKLCQGTLLSRAQYLKDISDWGYQDARLPPYGKMTVEEANRWTQAATDQSNSFEDERDV
jgi:hypothetical protein